MAIKNVNKEKPIEYFYVYYDLHFKHKDEAFLNIY